MFYANGKFFNKEGKEVPPPNEEVVLGDRVTGTSGAPGGGDPGMYLTPRADDPDKPTKSEENEALKQKYYKIMGLDKMKKDAVYDSLIDASRIVQEEGADLKGSLKSGTLQNKIIQAISSQLDKSAALKKQIDAAILKGEITKDIKANDPAEKNKAKLVEKQLALADKKLAGSDLDDIAAEYRKSQLPLKGQTLFTEANRAGTDVDGILSTKEVDEFLNDNPTLTEADYIEKVQKDRLAKGDAVLPEGNYVVGGRIVHISDGGLVDRFVF